ncbi:unnamed protein product [Protopolystoma xenopodis]|uniref:Uncharacterized protein n=1 Tax=Protopolystoma xenopodis TaxID=117903 RepID=A0A3S5BH45_9PLAT|nr:unnamed protein product [Protopolystoma xenopodis]
MDRAHSPTLGSRTRCENEFRQLADRQHLGIILRISLIHYLQYAAHEISFIQQTKDQSVLAGIKGDCLRNSFDNNVLDNPIVSWPRGVFRRLLVAATFQSVYSTLPLEVEMSTTEESCQRDENPRGAFGLLPDHWKAFCWHIHQHLIIAYWIVIEQN